MLKFFFKPSKKRLSGYRRTKLPDKLSLTAIDREIELIYISEITQGIRYELSENTLALKGDVSDIELVSIQITKILKKLAREVLLSICEQAAIEIGVTFNRLSIRGQKTRWGSCSSQSNINLNYKLLFLTQEQMRYVIYHELVHLIHFNHSKKFWQTLSEYIPNAKKIGSQLRQYSLRNDFMID